jgi:hypothetical protein
MAHRAELANPLARQAVNAVDVVFAGNSDVRTARHMFMAAVSDRPVKSELIVERYHSMIEAVARAMAVGTNVIGPIDIRMGYYPEAAAQLDMPALAEAEEKIARAAAKKKTEKP